MQVKRTELIQTLSVVKPGLAKKDIVEQATHFIFTGKEIVTYNDFICISHPFKTDFSCSVNADKLFKILSSMNDDTVDLKLTETQLSIKASKTRSGLSALKEGPVLEYITSLKLSDIKKWKSLPDDFATGIFLCMFSASRDMTHGPLVNICIRKNVIIASDDLRISKYEMSSAYPGEVLLPIQSVLELVKFKVTKYHQTDSWIHFKTDDDVVFSTRVGAAEYPDPLQFFATEGAKVVIPKEAREAIKAVSIMTDGVVDIDRKISVTVSSGLLTCRGEQETGWVEKDVDLRYKGRQVVFQVNPAFLYQVLDKSTKMTIGEGKALFETAAFQHVMVLPV